MTDVYTDLRVEAEAAARACGVDLAAHAGDQEGRSPLTGAVVSSLRWDSADDVAGVVAAASKA